MTVTASRRRELVDELVHERSRAVAELDVDDDEPHPMSPAWGAGITRLVVRVTTKRTSSERRELVRSIAVVAIAWLEAFDDR